MHLVPRTGLDYLNVHLIFGKLKNTRTELIKLDNSPYTAYAKHPHLKIRHL